MEMRKIHHVTPLHDYKLLCQFDNGEQRVYDLSPLLRGVFEYCRDIDNFKSVQLVRGALTWFRPEGSELNLCPDSVYMKSTPYKDDQNMKNELPNLG